jgi:cytosine deaminase
MQGNIDPTRLLAIAIEEARLGASEGGIPIGAALFDGDGSLLGRGHNRRVQENDPSIHGETDAFRKAGRQRSYRDTIMATTLAPCWYCSGLVRQFGIGTVIVGESTTFQGGIDWLRENGVDVIDLDNADCKELLGRFIAEHPEIWNEDIGDDATTDDRREAGWKLKLIVYGVLGFLAVLLILGLWKIIELYIQVRLAYRPH